MVIDLTQSGIVRKDRRSIFGIARRMINRVEKKFLECKIWLKILLIFHLTIIYIFYSDDLSLFIHSIINLYHKFHIRIVGSIKIIVRSTASGLLICHDVDLR